MMVFYIVRDINIIIVFFRLNIAWDGDCLLISNFLYWRVCSWCGPTWGFLWGWNTQKGIRCKASVCLCIFDQVVLHDFHGFQWSSHILVDQIPISQRKLRSSHDTVSDSPQWVSDKHQSSWLPCCFAWLHCIGSHRTDVQTWNWPALVVEWVVLRLQVLILIRKRYKQYLLSGTSLTMTEHCIPELSIIAHVRHPSAKKEGGSGVFKR